MVAAARCRHEDTGGLRAAGPVARRAPACRRQPEYAAPFRGAFGLAGGPGRPASAVVGGVSGLKMRAPSTKPGLLTLTIKDKSALYLAYMPFVKNGGLFIPTNSSYRLGDEVFMLLNLMGEDEKLPVAGRVIWLTPKGAQGKRTAGIGVQFSEQDRGATQKKIESYLAGALGGDKATHTM